MTENGEGRELKIQIPLEDWVKQIVEESADRVARKVSEEFQKSCPAYLTVDQVKEDHEKLDNLRLRFWLLTGILAGGGGFLGGLASRLVG